MPSGLLAACALARFFPFPVAIPDLRPFSSASATSAHTTFALALSFSLALPHALTLAPSLASAQILSLALARALTLSVSFALPPPAAVGGPILMVFAACVAHATAAPSTLSRHHRTVRHTPEHDHSKGERTQ
jgi:hypothetical protein